MLNDFYKEMKYLRQSLGTKLKTNQAKRYVVDGYIQYVYSEYREAWKHVKGVPLEITIAKRKTKLDKIETYLQELRRANSKPVN